MRQAPGPDEVRLPIGEFAKMTHLSVKALRHYHELGVLEPAAVDAATGYRSYTTNQVTSALAIRRFRDLDMPLDEVRTVLHADDDARRDAILAHLERMEERLEATHAAVASLRSLLLGPPAPAHAVARRELPTEMTVAVHELVSRDDIGDWCAEVFPLLQAAADGPHRVAPPAPDGALYFERFFEADLGDVLAFAPIAEDHPVPAHPRVRRHRLVGGSYAVLTHEGAFDELDLAYAALGSWVAEQGIGVPGPIRERYLVGPADEPDPARHVTEVCWPVTTR